ncbi:hypothetical protein ACFOOK_01515 [Micromonospora krabiensis]|uniref:Uncharacterized protein n=1 Tax=Micromonospora krabiensis TaxID=307121 RepID=A0A1C3MXA2_9ACTN|nr:hypothetical protein [Micromonospora krabiensis]SBV24941.1 hypothetical protein GA0070620_0406 [Micromonospora krabiensis]
MSRWTDRLRATYGGGLRHVLVMLVCFTVAGWVVARLAGEPTAGRMLLWFVGAAVAHDLLLFPVYATVDHGLRRATRAGGREAGPAARVALLNHLRAAALAAALLFLVFLPGILGLTPDTYRAATGQERVPYLARWLAVTGVLFLVSAVWWAIRWARWRRPSQPQ